MSAAQQPHGSRWRSMPNLDHNSVATYDLERDPEAGQERDDRASAFLTRTVSTVSTSSRAASVTFDLPAGDDDEDDGIGLVGSNRWVASGIQGGAHSRSYSSPLVGLSSRTESPTQSLTSSSADREGPATGREGGLEHQRSERPGINFCRTSNPPGTAGTNSNDGGNASSRDISPAASFGRSDGSIYDNGLLTKALDDAGRWAFGTIFVECWVLSHDKTHLFRPTGGSWLDPVFHPPDNEDCRINCPKCRLVNRLMNAEDPEYVVPGELAPGEGLQGVLWSETSSNWSFLGGGAQYATVSGSSGQDTTVKWRNVLQLAADPDQPWNPRLQLLAELDLGWAAGIPFQMHGQKGIVVYMARSSVKHSRLQSSTNHRYLLAAADLIGSAYALRAPRQEVVEERRQEVRAIIARVRVKLLLITRLRSMRSSRMRSMSLGEELMSNGETMDKETGETETQKEAGAFLELCEIISRLVKALQASAVAGVDNVKIRAMAMWKKCQGGGKAPPIRGFTWRETILTFSGVTLTLAMLTSLNMAIMDGYDGIHRLALGPFGALMTLQYGLTAAPATQPRNIFLGQVISLAIAVAFSYINEAWLPVWARQSLTTGTVVATMVKIGITHPPAGAAALVFSSGLFGWGSMVFMLIANVLAILTAMLFNNLSDRRRYPIYWGVFPRFDIAFNDLIHSQIHRKDVVHC